jgi:hypothetical protein
MKVSKFLLVSGVLTGLVLLSRQLFFKPVRLPARYILDDSSLDESSIRDIAQQIWESEGKPEGQAARHWAMATELLKSRLAADGAISDGYNIQSPADPRAYADKNNIH